MDIQLPGFCNTVVHAKPKDMVLIQNRQHYKSSTHLLLRMPKDKCSAFICLCISMKKNPVKSRVDSFSHTELVVPSITLPLLSAGRSSQSRLINDTLVTGKQQTMLLIEMHQQFKV